MHFHLLQGTGLCPPEGPHFLRRSVHLQDGLQVRPDGQKDTDADTHRRSCSGWTQPPAQKEAGRPLPSGDPFRVPTPPIRVPDARKTQQDGAHSHPRGAPSPRSPEPSAASAALLSAAGGPVAPPGARAGRASPSSGGSSSSRWLLLAVAVVAALTGCRPPDKELSVSTDGAPSRGTRPAAFPRTGLSAAALQEDNAAAPAAPM